MTATRPASETLPTPGTPEDRAAAGAIRLQDEPGHLIRRAHQLAVSVFHDCHGRQITPVQ